MNPSEWIDQLIEGISDWRGKTLAAVRKAILSADKGITEEWKWKGSPCWFRDGMIAVANAHKDKVKITFMHGAKLKDAGKLFNAGLGGGAWRAIDLLEGDKVDGPALRDLVREAIAYNQSTLKKNLAPAAGKGAGKAATSKTATSKTTVKSASSKAVRKSATTSTPRATPRSR